MQRMPPRFQPLELQLDDIPPEPCPHVAEPAGIGGRPVVVDDMRVWACSRCGQAWLIGESPTVKLIGSGSVDNWNALTRAEQRLVRKVIFRAVRRRKKIESQYSGTDTEGAPDSESIL